MCDRNIARTALVPIRLPDQLSTAIFSNN